MFLIYNAIRYFLYPILFVGCLFSKKKRAFLFSHFKMKKINNKNSILIHLSSVGELNLSEELIKKLLSKNEKVLVFIFTNTGIEHFNKKYKNVKNIEYIKFPLDDFLLIKRIFKKNKIKKVIIIETEIWPNLFYLARKYAKLYIVNGRITDKNIGKYLKIKKIINKTLDNTSKIMVQTLSDKKKYMKLGIKKEKIKVFPNLKYSVKYDMIADEKKSFYKKNYLQENKKIIVCGSTRENEEMILLFLFLKIDNFINNYQLIFVPRHPDRVEQVLKEINKIHNIDVSLFSEIKKSDIIVVDKLGILRELYQIADFAFVGGTFVDKGGHSILEPLYYGRPTMIGEYYQNIEDIVNDFKNTNILKIMNEDEDIEKFLDEKSFINSEEIFKEKDKIDEIIKEIYN